MHASLLWTHNPWHIKRSWLNKGTAHPFRRSSPISTHLDLLKLLHHSQTVSVPDPFLARLWRASRTKGLATRDYREPDLRFSFIFGRILYLLHCCPLISIHIGRDYTDRRGSCRVVMNIEEVDTEPWGWSVFFDNIKSFLQDLRRKFGLCNLRYVEYALERL